DWGMPAAAVLRAATVVAADLINRPDTLGRLAEGYLADIIAVPGDPLADISVTRDVNFVMKDGKVFKNDVTH
ncbi:amidohydrolase, partial [Enterococcus faecium]